MSKHFTARNFDGYLTQMVAKIHKDLPGAGVSVGYIYPVEWDIIRDMIMGKMGELKISTLYFDYGSNEELAVIKEW